MQPTMLVKSRNKLQAIVFNRLVASFVSNKESLLTSLKSVSWAAAFGSLFVFSQTYALSLQNIQINSALGEPLDAVVMVNAAPGEVLNASCMRSAFNTESGMPGIRGVQLSLSRQLSPGTLRLTTSRAVTEPMSEVVVHIECPGAPSVKRSFLIMLDPRPAGADIAPATTPAVIRAVPQPQTTSAGSRERPPVAAPVVSSTNNRVNVRSRQVIVSRGVPVAPGGDYIVKNGDALSTIAARIKDRDFGTVWSWAATIQAANPHAFINGNPNELIAGSKLYVPKTIAAGTESLSVPQTASTTSVSPSRYADRFSTRTNDTQAGNNTPSDLTQASVNSEPPVAVLVDPLKSAPTGAIRTIQPVMVMATSFSSLSRDRLRQRKLGLIYTPPEDLADLASNDSAPAALADAANEALETPTDQPAPEETQTPTASVIAKPEAATEFSTESRFSFLGLLGGLGLLAGAFFTGWWLSRRRAEAEIQEQVEARLNEERYRDRVRSGRQAAIREGMSSGAAAIEVTETAPERTHKPSDFEAVDDVDEIDDVIEDALQNDNAKAYDIVDSTDVTPVDDAETDESPLIDPSELEIDTTSNHELADIDLELLERDYAAQTETNTGLEDIAAAGQGLSKTSNAELDMEFPAEVKMRGKTKTQFDTLEFDARAEPLDFDFGSGPIDDDTDRTEALGLDLEEAGASIDAHLEQLKKEDQEWAQEEEEYREPTAEFDVAPSPDEEITDLVTENLIDDDSTASIERDPEEFYHLEASSIMNVGELDFEKGPDDETNILRFRQRSIRTGTDDTSGDEE